MTDSLIARIVSAKPDWRDVMAEISSLTLPDTTRGQALFGSAMCLDSVSRPYAVYVPSGYDSKTPTPLLVHLHGIVSRPVIERNLNEYVGDSAIMATAERRGWLVLFPLGQQGATWFDEVGMTNIMTQIRAVKAGFNVDDDRVYLSGLSDGASAAFLFAMVKPDDFAAFAALNGSMGVASEDGGFSTYAPNLANSYIYVTSADRDRYYPTAQMERTIAMAESAGANILYQRLTGEHISSILEFDYSTIFDYLEQHPRNPFPATIVWEAATPEFGLCRWLAIDDITIDEPAEWYLDYNVALVDSTISIGLIPYDTFAGPGVMVASVSDGDNVARRSGLKPGDIIVDGNGIPIDGLVDLGKLRATLKHGAEVTLKVKRGAGEILLNGRVPKPKKYFVFKREKPSAVLKASYQDNRFDLRSSRLGAFRILVSPGMIDLNKNVQVILDGEKVFDRRIVPDIGFMLHRFLDSRDRKAVFVNEISLGSM
ncbi:MAG: PDZ domain-containing protein [candidate division Zixibacteria bacterium]|nr:PDZ domain-containing protein [candidate division Zixibacteria bacterium]